MRQRGEVTKQQLIEAALDLFYSEGIHWTSFQKIGQKVGISQAALYKYFEDKDDLIHCCALAVAMSGRAFIDQKIDPSATAAARLRAYIAGNLEWAHKNKRDATTLVATFYVGLTSDKVKKTVHHISAESLHRLAVQLEHGNHEKAWTVSDPRATARHIHNGLMGEMIKLLHLPKEFALEQRIDLCWQGVEKLLR